MKTGGQVFLKKCLFLAIRVKEKPDFFIYLFHLETEPLSKQIYWSSAPPHVHNIQVILILVLAFVFKQKKKAEPLYHISMDNTVIAVASFPWSKYIQIKCSPYLKYYMAWDVIRHIMKNT